MRVNSQDCGDRPTDCAIQQQSEAQICEATVVPRSLWQASLTSLSVTFIRKRCCRSEFLVRFGRALYCCAFFGRKERSIHRCSICLVTESTVESIKGHHPSRPGIGLKSLFWGGSLQQCRTELFLLASCPKEKQSDTTTS